MIPPFLAGKEAYRQGQSCTPPEMPEGDCYPGARKMWIDGWNVAKNTAEHAIQLQRKAKALELLSDGKPRLKSEIFERVGEISREHWRRMIVRGALQAERVSAGAGNREWIYTAKETA